MPDLIERDAAIKLIQPRVKPKTVYGEGYLNAIEHVTELLSMMPSANCWIPCIARLPKVGEPVLIYDPYNEEMVVVSLDCDKMVFSNDDCWYGLRYVPFWMPLQQPPKEMNNNDEETA